MKGHSRLARVPVKKLKGLCPFSQKVRFRDPKEAKMALRNVQARRTSDIEVNGESRRREVRWYACGCGGTHLTSQAA